MKGCALSAVLSVLFYAAITAVFVLFFKQRYQLGFDDSWGASAGAGLFAWLSLSWLFGIRQPLRERATIQTGMSGERPIDGTHAAIVGTITTREQPLRAPLSGADCVFFKYEIYRYVRSGRSSTKSTVYDGTALVPSSIAARSGSYRLLCVPAVDFDAEPLNADSARERAKQHIASTTFETPAAGKISDEWSDDDGAFRREQRHRPDDDTLAGCSFTEQHIKRGETVCVFGLYSQERQGIVPDPNWAKQTRIMKGDMNTVMASLSARVRNYLLGALITGAISAGIVYWFLAYIV